MCRRRSLSSPVQPTRSCSEPRSLPQGMQRSPHRLGGGFALFTAFSETLTLFGEVQIVYMTGSSAVRWFTSQHPQT